MKIVAVILLGDFSLWLLLYWCKKMSTIKLHVVLISVYMTCTFCAMALS